MLRIVVPATEYWDETNQEFVYGKEQTLQLEHSLVSISNWESKWHKAFLGKQPKTQEESTDYVRCMTITQNVDQKVYSRLTNAHMQKINEYISAPMTAVYRPKESNKGGGSGGRDTVTAEVIYYWMISYGIPFDCQKWHLNRLLSLIYVCNLKNTPAKKRNSKEMMQQRAALNAARKAQLNSNG